MDEGDRVRVMEDVRRRDGERFVIETVEGIDPCRDLIHGDARRKDVPAKPDASS